MIVEIDGNDYSGFVNKRKYNVNQTRVVKKWEDANHVQHGDVLRTKISGSFVLTFTNVDDYNDFVQDVVSAVGTDGKIPVELLVGTLNTTVSFNAFMTFSVKVVFQAYADDTAMFQVTCNVEEE